MMELKDFIKGVIADITEAISESQSELNNGAIVSPSQCLSGKAIRIKDYGYLVSDIDFEVVLTTEESSKGGGNLGANIKVLSFGINGDNVNKSENLSRVRFTIPVVYPSVDVSSYCKNMAPKRTEPVDTIRHNPDQ